MHRVHIQEVLKFFWIIQKIRLIISKKIFVIVLQVIATTPQKWYTTWKMPQYGDFVVSSPASPRTERKNYAIVGKSKKKYYFNLLIFRWSTNLNLTTPSICCFLRPTVCHAQYYRNCTSCGHDYWHTYAKWFSFFKNILLGCW